MYINLHTSSKHLNVQEIVITNIWKYNRKPRAKIEDPTIIKTNVCLKYESVWKNIL